MIGFFKHRSFLCGASVIGPSHIKNNIVNQDSFLLVKKRKYILCVVSDGMGSKKFADVGSKNACLAVKKEIGNFVKNKQNPLSMKQLFSNIIETWNQLNNPHESRNCSATCLFVFATKNKILAARLGDGMICLLGKNDAENVSLTENKDSNFSNSTQCLSDSYAADEFNYSFYDRKLFRGIVLSSDGISSDMEDGKEILFSEDLFNEVKKLRFWKRKNFLQSMMENWPVLHHTDDKTLAVGGL